ncbi:MAG: hydroxymethylbilane synthase [Bacteroidota bacterium]
MLKIGTRGSTLALWQTEQVRQLLARKGKDSAPEIIQTFGDQNLHQPIYQYGIQGIFTRSLDTALLNEQVDLAVHSLKDVPTILAEGLVLVAVLPRGSHQDVLVGTRPWQEEPIAANWHIATSSLRRKAQWAHRYPNSEFSNIRGNIQTRLAKTQKSSWDGVIMAEAALQRLEISDQYPIKVLDWMIPAPAQGAIGIVCREDQKELIKLLAALTHEPTHKAVSLERSFLRTLQAGCSSPVGALAQISGEEIYFQAVILSTDGSNRIYREWTLGSQELAGASERYAESMIKAGAAEILKDCAYEN